MKIRTIDKLQQTQVDVYKCTMYSSKKYYLSSLLNLLKEQNEETNIKRINFLRNLNKENEAEAKDWKKKKLKCYTVSATFNEHRLINDVKDKTGLIAIDIDKDDNKGLDVEKAKKDVMTLAYAMYTMISCRGEGIWVLIPYNVDNDIYEVFNALEDDFKELGYIIDKSCKDITRLRVFSYDENAIYREECEVYEKTKKEVKVNENNHYEDNVEYIADNKQMTKQDLKDLVTIIYVLTHHLGYHKDNYNEWLLDGFRLATVPNKEVGLKLFDMISENSSNYKGYEDVRKKFEECYRRTTYKTNILGYYFNIIKEKLGENWRFRVNEILKGSKL